MYELVFLFLTDKNYSAFISTSTLTRAVLVACVFRVVLGGGVFTPLSNSAPGPRSDTR